MRLNFWCKLNFKYPGLFLTLFDYRLDTNNIKIDFSDTDLSKFPMEFRKEKLKKWESKYTAIECFSLIDDVLPSIYNVKKKIYYNCFIQYAYLIYILHMENTMNGDVHANNVGIIDAGYRGHLMGMFDVIYENETIINKFDRHLQICAPGLIPIIVEMVNSKEDLGEKTARGDGGFGSTGV